MKSVQKSIKFFLSILISILFFISCNKSENSADDNRTIAFVMKTLNNPFFIDMKNGAEVITKKYNFNLLVQAAEREVDVEKQMQIIENLIQRKVSALCITPSGSKEVVPAIVKANEAGIPVIIVDTRVDLITLNEAGGTVLAFIGSDNYDGGRLAGKYIIEQLSGKGNVAVLEGIPGHETGDDRLKGFNEEISKFNNMKIITSQTANWERDQGFTVFQNILQAHPEVDAVFACNDMMALGAIEAIRLSQKKKKIIVVGFDAILDSREAILNGTMSASIAQNPEEMGKLSIEYAIKAINDENIPSEIPVRIELITKEVLLQKGN
ncbi:MAG: sugar ABC transporter substrate-binding protein [Melioribacter sp.]|nr:sugar ABC transporter substrate-binding protein [Melioribacter sp.]